MTPPRKAKKSAQKTTIQELTLEYHLDALPSSQHRAGLAGLLLMHRWRARQPEQRGICDLDITGPRSLRIRFDRDGLAQLFDLTYAAEVIHRPYPKPFKNKPPLREEPREEVNTKTGESKTKTVYIYPVVVPKGAYLEDWDETRNKPDGGKWIKLWRDMVWNILRGVPATRAPFEARAGNKTDRLAAQAFDDLAQPGKSVDLPSTYYLGAQAVTAENVKFRDLARHQFLLHFWPFVAPIYIPETVDAEGKRQFQGYAITVPDIVELAGFCEQLEYIMSQRSDAVAGYVPAQAVIDLPAAGALDLMARLTERIGKQNAIDEDLVCGVDVFHMAKVGNNVRVLGTRRVDVEFAMVDRYLNIRDKYREHRFRRQQLLNLLDRKPWHTGFDRIFSTVSTRWTIESTWFCRDVRTAFKNEALMTEKTDQEQSLESLIYRIVGVYIAGKLDSKHGIKWKDVEQLDEDNDQRKHYRTKRQDIAKDAFLSIRSRTGQDFVDYFSGTLFSYPQRLGEVAFRAIARALLDDTDKVRTLTLLALSARA